MSTLRRWCGLHRWLPRGIVQQAVSVMIVQANPLKQQVIKIKSLLIIAVKYIIIKHTLPIIESNLQIINLIPLPSLKKQAIHNFVGNEIYPSNSFVAQDVSIVRFHHQAYRYEPYRKHQFNGYHSAIDDHSIYESLKFLTFWREHGEKRHHSQGCQHRWLGRGFQA